MGLTADRAQEIVADNDANEAATLLEMGDLDQLDQATLDALVRCAIEVQLTHPYYFRVMDLVSPDVLEEMNTDVGEQSEVDDLKKVLKDDRSAPHRDAIMRAFIESADADAMSELFPETIGLVSADVQKDMVAVICGSDDGVETIINMLMDESVASSRRAVAQAIKDHGEWDNDDLALIIQEAGHLLDDVTIVLLARAMQDEETVAADGDPDPAEA